MKSSLTLFIILVLPLFIQAMDEETVVQAYLVLQEKRNSHKTHETTDHQQICNAFKEKDTKTIEKFIAKSTDLNQHIIYTSDEDQDGENLKLTTLLELAWQHTLPNIISLLRQKNVSIEQTDAEGNTPLAQALYHKAQDTATIFLLITKNIINQKNKKGSTPLHIMLTQSGAHLNVIDLLLEQGADLTSQDNAGNTPIHFASKDPSGKILYFMLENIENEDLVCELVNTKNEQGATALHLAITRYLDDKKEDMHSIAFLLQAGADLTIANTENITPLGLVKNACAMHESDDQFSNTYAQNLYDFIEKCTNDEEFLNSYLEDFNSSTKELKSYLKKLASEPKKEESPWDKFVGLFSN